MGKAALRQIRDAASQPGAADLARRAPVVARLAGVDCLQSCKDAQQRRLAGAVGADQAGELARSERAIDARERGAAGEPDFDSARDDAHHASFRRRSISPNRNGAPISAVATPSLSSGWSGTRRTATSAAESTIAPPKPLASSSRPGRWPTSGRSRCGDDQADEADRASDRHRSADRQRGASDEPRAQARKVEAEAGRGVLAERQRVERRRARQQQRPASKHQRQRQPQLRQAAVGERAHQPEHDFVGGVRVRRQVERQRGQRAGEAVDRHPGEDQRHRSGAAAGQRIERQRRDDRAGDAAERKREREDAGEAGIEDDDRAERRAAGDADDAGIGERIAQQPLQRRAGEAEAETDRRAKRGARQAQLFEHQRGQGVAAGECVGERRAQIEGRVADAERDKRGGERQRGERGGQRPETTRARRARAHGGASPRARRGRRGGEPTTASAISGPAQVHSRDGSETTRHPPRQRRDDRVIERRVGKRRRAGSSRSRINTSASSSATIRAGPAGRRRCRARAARLSRPARARISSTSEPGPTVKPFGCSTTAFSRGGADRRRRARGARPCRRSAPRRARGSPSAAATSRICRRTPSSVCGAPTSTTGAPTRFSSATRRRIGERADEDEVGTIGERLLGVAVDWPASAARLGRHLALRGSCDSQVTDSTTCGSASRSASSSAHRLSETTRCGLAMAGAAIAHGA